MELRWWKRKRLASVLHVTQNKLGDDGKPGTQTVPDVACMGIIGDRLCGYANDGRLVAMLPLAEVAVAIVSDKL